MNIKPIHTKRDYKAALKSVEGLMNARAGSPEGDRLDILVTLIQAYEAKHSPMLPPSPVARGQSQPPFHFSLFLAENPVALTLSVGCSVSLH